MSLVFVNGCWSISYSPKSPLISSLKNTKALAQQKKHRDLLVNLRSELVDDCCIFLQDIENQRTSGQETNPCCKQPNWPKVLLRIIIIIQDFTITRDCYLNNVTTTTHHLTSHCHRKHYHLYLQMIVNAHHFYTQMICIYIYRNPQNDRKSESSLIQWGYTNFYHPIFDHGAEWICQCPAWAASEQGWAQMLCWAPAPPSLGFWNFTKKWGFHGILFAKLREDEGSCLFHGRFFHAATRWYMDKYGLSQNGGFILKRTRIQSFNIEILQRQQSWIIKTNGIEQIDRKACVYWIKVHR